MRKFIFITLLCALVVFGCEDKSDTHTHEWGEWQYNETEHWKECTANDGAKTAEGNHTGDPCADCGYATPQPIDKTFPITLKDTKNNDLVFTVKYKAYAIDPEPAYLTYIKERLEAVVSNTSNTTIMAVDNLIAKGSSYTIRIVAGNEAGFTWNSTTREFEVQHDWISTATDTDLTLAMLRSAFNSVQAE